MMKPGCKPSTLADHQVHVMPDPHSFHILSNPVHTHFLQSLAAQPPSWLPLSWAPKANAVHAIPVGNIVGSYFLKRSLFLPVSSEERSPRLIFHILHDISELLCVGIIVGGSVETGVCALASCRRSDLLGRAGQKKLSAWQEGTELQTSRRERKRAGKIQDGARSKGSSSLGNWGWDGMHIGQ